ncbi:glycosyltransferase family protein [Echinicola sediminis]
MKFIFIVQGEGRGHMTQAISLYRTLKELGHEVPHVLIGKSQRRSLPDFVKRNLTTHISQFESPNFVTDKKEKSINIFKTIFSNSLKCGQFYQSLKTIDQVVKKHQPDIIINFYDNLAGLYHFFYRPQAKFWAIGHQYLIYHPEFPFAPNQPLQQVLFKLNTWLTALGADQLLALSFRPLPEHTNKRLAVVPPLLRPEIKHLHQSSEDFILTYIVNPGYADEIISLCKKQPNIKIEAFWDKKDAPDTYTPLPNITFHQINDRLFLEKMAGCRGLLCTAGFESVCEAMYLGKQVMMVPVKGQYEQACNALDAVNAEAGISGTCFDIEGFDSWLKTTPQKELTFPKWQAQFSAKISKIIHESQEETVYELGFETEFYA